MRTYRYRGFVVEPKRDFVGRGFFIGGKFVKKGWVVVYPPGHRHAGCNAMPAATWDTTLRGARGMVDAFITARGNAARFWRIVHAGA